MIFDAEYYQKKAEALHEREREIKAARGEIVDRNGTVLATNRTVCTISVIHSQIKDQERVIEVLAEELELEPKVVRKRVEKVSSMERIKTNVPKEIGDKIREYDLAGVKVDEDFKRYYPYETLASKVLGFTGGDNQGIIGLEVKYEKYLKGQNGMILTTADARGIELDGIAEDRIEPVPGNTLQLSIDYNLSLIHIWCSSGRLRPECESMVDIIFVKARFFDLFWSQIFRQLVYDCADHLHMSKLLGTDTVSYTHLDVYKRQQPAAAQQPGTQTMIELDGKQYFIADDIPEALIPEGYEKSQLTYEGSPHTILVHTGSGQKMIYLMDTQGEGNLFLYDSETDHFSAFEKIDLSSDSYILILSLIHI